MSNGDTGGTGPPDVGTITVTVTEMAGPSSPTDIPWKEIEDYVRETRQVLENDWGMSPWFAHLAASLMAGLAGVVIVLAHLVILLLKIFLPSLAGTVFKVLDDLRKTLDPQFAAFSVAVLNELLGTDFTLDHLPQGTDVAAHLARAQEIGFLFHRQLMREFLSSTGMTLDPAGGNFSEASGPTGRGELITPMSGVRAAATFSGLAINFGTATGIIGTIGGLVPEVHLNEIREIGEEVAKNLGLGRLQRLALAPIVQILLAEPYKWFINEVARPTQFKLGDVVNPFTGAHMPADLVWRSLAREGYSDDKIQALLDLHSKKPTEADILTLFEAGHIEQTAVQTALKDLGYEGLAATTKFEADQIRALKTFQDELRAAVVTAYADGHIERGELEDVINGLALSQDERTIALVVADYKKKVPNKTLTLAQLESAFEQGILDLAQFTDALTKLGYSQDDQDTLLILTLLKLQKLTEAAAAKAAKAAKAAAKTGGTPPAPPPLPTVP